MHIVPWEILKSAITVTRRPDSDEEYVTTTREVFGLLMEAALSGQPFDEKQYATLHTDVARAARSGDLPNARAHYIANGYYEGRETGPAGFDEAWYLSRYPDVQKAVAKGASRSAYEHYRGSGQTEGRAPNRLAERDVARWREAMRPPEPNDPGARKAMNGRFRDR
jgi:hypothetical protein